jgi:hypothetical protein
MGLQIYAGINVSLLSLTIYPFDCHKKVLTVTTIFLEEIVSLESHPIFVLFILENQSLGHKLGQSFTN